MKEQSKKLVAAMAAVTQYIASEQELGAPLPEDAAAAAAGRAALAPVNVWGISGRQSQMQLRTMMQLRAMR